MARRGNKLLFRWRKRLLGDVPEPAQELIYGEAEQPELFAYFMEGAPGQILDNADGNALLGVANGTKCWLPSLGGDDETVAAEAEQLADAAIRSGSSIVDLPHPPQYVNVRLADRDGKELDGANWPSTINLDTEWVYDATGVEQHKRGVVVPIGLARSNSDYAVNVTGPDGSSVKVRYAQHAVDLGMVLTVWKAQGSTFNRVILLLEGSNGAPHWLFEHDYVAMSRVRTLDSIRCLPLSPGYDTNALMKLRPSVFTVKWLLDLDEHGRWQPRS
jgi:hypothetical protein